MLGSSKWLSIVLVVALMTIGLGASVGADSGTEQGFLSAINSERTSRGMGALKMDGSLQAHARRHTADMIAAGEIYHSSSAELQAAAGSGWSRLGENVGRGGTVSSLHQAFMDSSGHRANILGDYNYVGIGTNTSSDGILYVTVVFMKKGSTSGGGGGTTTSPKPKPKPQPTTTTSTFPPTTTTTLIVGPDKPVTPGVSCFSATRLFWMCHD
jgi:hypothetical protein